MATRKRSDDLIIRIATVLNIHEDEAADAVRVVRDWLYGQRSKKRGADKDNARAAYDIVIGDLQLELLRDSDARDRPDL